MSKVKVTAEFRGHPVITGDYKLFGYNDRHLKNNLEMMESAVKRHNKKKSYRMDIRLPVNSEKVKVKKKDRKFIKDFMSSYTNKLARAGLDPDYVVKAEQKTSEYPFCGIPGTTKQLQRMGYNINHNVLAGCTRN